MSNALIKGAGYALTGLHWLPKTGLRGFVIVPLLINTVLFSIGIWWSTGQLENFDHYLQRHLPSWLHWLHWLLWPLFILAALVVIFYTFTVVANVIATPFNSLLAEQVEKRVNPDRTPRPTSNLWWKELALSPLAELGKLLYFIGWAIPLLLLSLLSLFIPVIAPALPVLWALFSAWMLALQYADYPLSNRGLTFRNQRRLLRRHWPLTLGFGGMTLVLTLVPVLNFLVMPAAVIGATLLWSQELRPNNPA